MNYNYESSFMNNNYESSFMNHHYGSVASESMSKSSRSQGWETFFQDCGADRPAAKRRFGCF